MILATSIICGGVKTSSVVTCCGGGSGREVVDHTFSETKRKVFCHTISTKRVNARISMFDGDAKLRSRVREIEKKVEIQEFASHEMAVRGIARRGVAKRENVERSCPVEG